MNVRVIEGVLIGARGGKSQKSLLELLALDRALLQDRNDFLANEFAELARGYITLDDLSSKTC